MNSLAPYSPAGLKNISLGSSSGPAAAISEPGDTGPLRWKTSLEEVRPSSTGKALDLVAIGRSRVLPGREFVIQRGYLVQPIDDLFLGHRGCVATSSFRFLPEER